MEETKKKTIEDLAWDLYQHGSLIKWEVIKTSRKDFSKHSSYDVYMKAVRQYLTHGQIPSFEPHKTHKPPKKEYPIIKVPASGNPSWMGGARTWLFVYSKYHGNFILEGFYEEVHEYLKKNYTHYFYYNSLWYMGRPRGGWSFWKNNIGIFEPTKYRREWKYIIRPYGIYKGITIPSEEIARKTLKFKRMPKQWIKEFNKL